MHKRARWTVPTAVVVTALVLMTAPAFACGGLVGENGTIQLTRTVTLAAYHQGIERYVTSFQFNGQGKEVGSIVPLPGIPTKVERGGSWTLQRLEREVAPPIAPQADALRFAASNTAAKVILTAKIDALDITVLSGGGKSVGKWATDHGFLLTPDAPEMLDFYARRSPIFMAARFDASRARLLGQQTGDGTPIMLTIPVKRPWVPLRILSLGLGGTGKVIDADVFLLTDKRPELLAGGPGITMPRDEQANASLLTDLRIDKGMAWVPSKMWFTYLHINVPASKLDYDLAISTTTGAVPVLADTGVSASQAQLIRVPHGRVLWPLGIAAATGVLIFGLAGLFGRRRRTAEVSV